MLKDFRGFLVSDRFKGYLWYEMGKRAICHAHLKRDFQRMVDRDGKSAGIGRNLLAEHKLLFEAWHAFKNGVTDAATFYNHLQEGHADPRAHDALVPYNGPRILDRELSYVD